MKRALPEPGPAVVVAGLGNLVFSDDGAGVHAVRRWEARCPAGALALETGTAVLRFLPWLETATALIALDAFQTGGAPGTVYLTDREGVACQTRYASAHDLGLLDALRSLGAAAPPTLIIGVEPAVLQYGMELSPQVEAALPRMLELVDLAVAEAGGPSSAWPDRVRAAMVELQRRTP